MYYWHLTFYIEKFAKLLSKLQLQQQRANTTGGKPVSGMGSWI